MMTRYDIRNAMIDALEQVCSETHEYYALNHIKPEKLSELENYLVDFCKSIGIKFTI